MGKEIQTVSPERLEAKRMAQFQFVLMLAQTNLEPHQLAEKLAKGDPKKAKRIRQRYQRWARDPDFAEIVRAQVAGQLLLGLPQSANALVRRAAKGNVPAIKLLMESSGFWSPRTTQEHVGEIAVTIRGIERAPLVTDEDNVIEGDVVEEK